jgi:CheY-like chemotaxis protein
LVVEDEADYADLLAEWLREDGYEVDTAVDGIEAFQLLRSRRPDVITLDMQMPRKGGVEFYRELKSNHNLRDVPVIVVTGLTVDDRDIETFIRTFLDVAHLPMPDAYLEKPVDGGEFLRVVRDSLRPSPVSA